jgi:hypothetical protein
MLSLARRRLQYSNVTVIIVTRAICLKCFCALFALTNVAHMQQTITRLVPTAMSQDNQDQDTDERTLDRKI